MNSVNCYEASTLVTTTLARNRALPASPASSKLPIPHSCPSCPPPSNFLTFILMTSLSFFYCFITQVCIPTHYCLVLLFCFFFRLDTSLNLTSFLYPFLFLTVYLLRNLGSLTCSFSTAWILLVSHWGVQFNVLLYSLHFLQISS